MGHQVGPELHRDRRLHIMEEVHAPNRCALDESEATICAMAWEPAMQGRQADRTDNYYASCILIAADMDAVRHAHEQVVSALEALSHILTMNAVGMF